METLYFRPDFDEMILLEGIDQLMIQLDSNYDAAASQFGFAPRLSKTFEKGDELTSKIIHEKIYESFEIIFSVPLTANPVVSFYALQDESGEVVYQDASFSITGQATNAECEGILFCNNFIIVVDVPDLDE